MNVMAEHWGIIVGETTGVIPRHAAPNRPSHCHSIVLLREVVPHKAYCAAERSCAAQGILLYLTVIHSMVSANDANHRNTLMNEPRGAQ